MLSSGEGFPRERPCFFCKTLRISKHLRDIYCNEQCMKARQREIDEGRYAASLAAMKENRESRLASTYANPPELPPLTLESIQEIMLRFSDQATAVPRAIRLHPDYHEVFVGNLREEGVVGGRPDASDSVRGMPVILDSEVPYGEIRYDFGDDLK